MFFRSYFSDLSGQELLGVTMWSFAVDPMIIWPLPDFLCYKIGPFVWGDILRDPVPVFLVFSKPLEVVLAKVLRAEKTKLYPASSQSQSRWVNAPFRVESTQSSPLVIKRLVGLLKKLCHIGEAALIFVGSLSHSAVAVTESVLVSCSLSY